MHTFIHIHIYIYIHIQDQKKAFEGKLRDMEDLLGSREKDLTRLKEDLNKYFNTLQAQTIASVKEEFNKAVR